MAEEWFSMETIRRIHPFYVPAFMRYVCIELNKKYGLRIDGATYFHSNNTELLFKRKMFDSRAKKIIKKIINDPELMEQEHKKLIKASEKWKKISNKILKTNLSKLSDKKLAGFLKNYSESYFSAHGKCAGHLLQLTEWENELYTKFIYSILQKKIKRYSLNESLAEAFALVSAPEKLGNMQKEERELFGLYLEIIKNKKLLDLFRKQPEKQIEKKLANFPKFSKKLDFHHKKWLWLPFMYEGPTWNKTYFISLLSSLARQYLTKEEITLKKKEPERLIKNKKEFLKKLPLTSKEKLYFKILSDSVYLKGYRKDVMYYSCFAAEKLFSETGKRLHLSLNQIRHFFPEEIVQALLYKKFSVKELNERIGFTVITWINGKEKLFTGKKARTEFNKIMKSMKIKKASRLQGSTAVPGLVKGKVKLVNHPNEMYKMKQGDIMVSHSTNPNLVPAMKKAGAIVTDVGGITCHAAIVSRELNIPCIIGTKVATRTLKDGEKVEVNASKGTVRRLK